MTFQDIYNNTKEKMVQGKFGGHVKNEIDNPYAVIRRMDISFMKQEGDVDFPVAMPIFLDSAAAISLDRFDVVRFPGGKINEFPDPSPIRTTYRFSDTIPE